MLWNFPCFSFLKNVSGIHTLELSVIVRYLIFPSISSYSSLLSYHCCRKVIWTLNSILTSSIFSKLLINSEPVTTVGAPKSSVLLLAPWNNPNISRTQHSKAENWIIVSVHCIQPSIVCVYIVHCTCAISKAYFYLCWFSFRPHSVVVNFGRKQFVEDPFLHFSEIFLGRWEAGECVREESGREDELVDSVTEAVTLAGHDSDVVTSDGVNIRHQPLIGRAEMPGGPGQSHYSCQLSQQHFTTFDNSHCHWQISSDGRFEISMLPTQVLSWDDIWAESPLPRTGSVNLIVNWFFFTKKWEMSKCINLKRDHLSLFRKN